TLALHRRTSSANCSGRPAGGTWPKPENGFGKRSNGPPRAHHFAENSATFLGMARCASLIFLLYRSRTKQAVSYPCLSPARVSQTVQDSTGRHSKMRGSASPI